LVPELDGPIYKGIFSDICLLLSAPNLLSENKRSYRRVNLLVKYDLLIFYSTKKNRNLYIHAKSTSDVIKQVVSRRKQVNREHGV
jgi:hypothetical protein